MSKDKISDYSATANSNTDIGGINIDEGCAPSGINDAIRTLMKQLKDFQQGTQSDVFKGPLQVGAASSIEVTDNTNAALRITQLGTGNALLVEDSTNPDSTPFVIDGNGTVLVGVTASNTLAGNTGLLQIESPNGAGNMSLIRNTANTSGPQFLFGKSRGADQSGRTIVSNGDTLGVVIWNGTDGTNYVQAAGISAQVDGTPGTNDMPGRLVFSTTADGASSPTERMRIDSSGNVGIGTSSPTVGYKLTVAEKVVVASNSDVTPNTTWAGQVTINGNGYSGGISMDSSGIWLGNTSASRAVIFATNETERARIDSSGNLLVGATSTINLAKMLVSFTSSNNGLYLDETSNSSGTQYVRFSQSGTTAGSITRVGTTSAVTYNTTSDYRLKDVIGAVSNSGQRIDALEPVEFSWKADGSLTRGFLAHKFQEVYPLSVTGEKDAIDRDGKPDYQSMQAGSAEVIADLVSEIQSLRKRIAALENK